MEKNNTKIIAFYLLIMVVFDLFYVLFEKEYRRKDDEPVKYQIFNIQTINSIIGTATLSTSPSPSMEAT